MLSVRALLNMLSDTLRQIELKAFAVVYAEISIRYHVFPCCVKKSHSLSIRIKFPKVSINMTNFPS